MSEEPRIGSPDPRVRVAALKAMLDAGDAGVCQSIALVLPLEPHPQVRAAMVMVLARLGGVAQAHVVAECTTDPEVGVRLRAVEALAGFDVPECAAVLVGVLGHEQEPRVRDVAAHYLMARGQESLLALFRDMLASEKRWKREAAVRACQLFNSALVVPLLEQAAVKEEVPAIRASARAGLERLASEGVAAAVEARAQLQAPAPAAVDTKKKMSMRELAFGDSYRGGRILRVEIEDPLSVSLKDRGPAGD